MHTSSQVDYYVFRKLVKYARAVDREKRRGAMEGREREGDKKERRKGREGKERKRDGASKINRTIDDDSGRERERTERTGMKRQRERERERELIVHR